jgi:hypothetical protein
MASVWAEAMLCTTLLNLLFNHALTRATPELHKDSASLTLTFLLHRRAGPLRGALLFALPRSSPTQSEARRGSPTS